ncbi:MAG TPA: bifunctional riboflavin kinase/FAD synthetase [Candidatus Limnocylindrales bacterium]|nr:bifunctional riboflavin kinase/FAD synthetase [Candidatus Limnocylindrales bacterium]
MKVLRSLERARGLLRRSVVTIGNFDGVHRGHQVILERLRSEASRRGASAVVLTFEPHPISVVRPEAAPLGIMTLPDRLRAIAAEGADLTIVQHFSRRFAAIDADEFIRRFLVEILDAQLILVGDDLNFGRDRGGNVATLARAGKDLDFEVEVVPPVQVDGVVARSSAIRELVTAGDVAAAGRLLGRPHFVRGRVEHGAGRGRGLGFATANLKPETALVPGDGVFVTVARLGRSRVDSVTSIGTTPTFGGTERAIEAHIFAELGDLYGKPLALEFLEKLRDQKRFESPAALTEQIASDVERARSILAARKRA